jgi:activator of 2-hydroxyglutaryl-CoA dehydratase
MRVLGIDLGSREVKIVVMEDNKIIKKQKISTMSFYRDYCSYDGKITLNLKKLNINNI